MKIVTIVGARPQFIKAAMVSRAIREYNNSLPFVRGGEGGVDRRIEEILVHTGQHYDHKMSQVFFDQLEIPEPNYHLEIGSGFHGDQTGRMLAGIEKVLLDEKPDAVLVYGDTNSTLAGSLAAAKLHIPVGHVEGGMRSFNRRMPEEINRVLTDHVAKWHFCATETAVKNLKAEGITEGVYLVGDVMHDAVVLYRDVAKEKSGILEKLGLLDCQSELNAKKQEARSKKLEDAGEAGLASSVSPLASNSSLAVTKYALATIHRAENTDDPSRLKNILEALVEISKDMPVVLPLHPRTRKAISDCGMQLLITNHQSPIADPESRVTSHELRRSGIVAIEPVSYLDMLKLESSASVILTDSGGMQKEAFWLNVPCITMRDETEWVETVEAGWNRVVGADKRAIISATMEYCGSSMWRVAPQPASLPDSASLSILDCLASSL